MCSIADHVTQGFHFSIMITRGSHFRLLIKSYNRWALPWRTGGSPQISHGYRHGNIINCSLPRLLSRKVALRCAASFSSSLQNTPSTPEDPNDRIDESVLFEVSTVNAASYKILQLALPRTLLGNLSRNPVVLHLNLSTAKSVKQWQPSVS